MRRTTPYPYTSKNNFILILIKIINFEKIIRLNKWKYTKCNKLPAYIGWPRGGGPIGILRGGGPIGRLRTSRTSTTHKFSRNFRENFKRCSETRKFPFKFPKNIIFPWFLKNLWQLSSMKKLSIFYISSVKRPPPQPRHPG